MAASPAGLSGGKADVVRVGRGHGRAAAWRWPREWHPLWVGLAGLLLLGAGSAAGTPGVGAVSREVSQTVGAVAEESVWLEVLTPWLGIDVDETDMAREYVERTGADGIQLVLFSNRHGKVFVWASYLPGTPALRREDVEIRVVGRGSLVPDYHAIPEGGLPIFAYRGPKPAIVFFTVDVRIRNLWEYAGPSVYRGVITFTAATN
ncbi:MAG TPA: hypothetical protein GXX55_03945 [Firmicutes bacterium]|nr:hypothetical protein [Bacillota bacterium]